MGKLGLLPDFGMQVLGLVATVVLAIFVVAASVLDLGGRLLLGHIVFSCERVWLVDWLVGLVYVID